MAKIIKYWDEPFPQGNMNSTLVAVKPARVIRNRHFYSSKLDEINWAYVPADTVHLKGFEDTKKITGRQQGGRSTTLEKRLGLGGQEFAINIKGSGNLFGPDYSSIFLAYSFYDDPKKLFTKKEALALEKLLQKRSVVGVLSDNCSGDTFHRPLGGQILSWAEEDLRYSEIYSSRRTAFSRRLGMYICPVLSVSVVPHGYLIAAKRTSDRRPVAQEIRLLPSNVRLLPDNGIKALRDCRLTPPESFYKNLIYTAVQICTLPIRSLQNCSRGIKGCMDSLVYDGVDLTKDGVIAADGKMYFADLEGITYIHLSSRIAPSLREDAEDTLNTVMEMITYAAYKLNSTGSSDKRYLNKKYIDLINSAMPKQFAYAKVSDISGRIILDVNKGLDSKVRRYLQG